MGAFTEKLHRELIFTDILMIGFNLIWVGSIILQMFGLIDPEFTGILWAAHFCFGIPSITWYLGLRARWIYTPEELRDMVAFNTSGCNCESYSNRNSSRYGTHGDG